MTDYDATAIGALLRRRGLPERPVVGVPVTEIRSDGFIGKVPTLEAGKHPAALSALILEWHYQIDYRVVPELIQFLVDNDVFIAQSCATAMTGVAYFGTYYGATGQRARFRTIWGYSSWAAHDEWSKVLATAGTANARLHDVITQLRSYWLSDPNGGQEHFAYAANVDVKANPFLDLTIAADAKRAGP